MRNRLLTAVLLCGIITMSCGCDLNVKVHKENDSDNSQSNQTISADNGSADNGSADNGSADNGSADGGNNSETTDSEVETERKPVLVCSENSFAAIKTDVMDTDGELLFAAKDSNGAWGYINTSGEWVIQPQFADAYSFSCGYAAVYGADGKAHFIDKSGNYLDDYDDIYYWGTFRGFNHGYARVYKGDEYQIIDTEGNVVNSGKSNNVEATNLLTDSSDPITGLWYRYAGGEEAYRKNINDSGYWFSVDWAHSVIAYNGDILEYEVDATGGEYFAYNKGASVNGEWNDYLHICKSENGEVVLIMFYCDNPNLYDSCFVLSNKGGSGYTVFDYNGTELMKLQDSFTYIGNGLFLIKNNVGNYAIVGVDGTEYAPYALGREAKKFSAAVGSEYILEINGKDYVVLWYPNAEVEIGEKPAYEFFDIEQKCIVEMDEIYATYIPFAFNVNGKAMLLEKDGLLMTKQGIQYLAHEPLNDIYYVTNPYPEINCFSFGTKFDEKFCFENNIYVVQDDGMHIGHIEY